MSEILALLIGNGLKWLEKTSGCAIFGGQVVKGGDAAAPDGRVQMAENAYNKRKDLFVSAQKILTYSTKCM